MNTHVSKWVDQGAPTFVIFGALVLGMLGAGLYDLARERVGANRLVLLLAIVVVFFPAVAHVLKRRLWVMLERRFRIDARPSLEIADVRKIDRRRRALIAISSTGPQKATDAIVRFHYRGEAGDQDPILRYCWLICGPGEGQNSSRANAIAIKQAYPSIDVALVDVDDPDDPQKAFRAVQGAYGQAAGLGILRSEIIADYTGGTKSMTAGLVLACTEQDKDLEYMKPRRLTADGRADPTAGSDPIAVDTNFFLKITQGSADEQAWPAATFGGQAGGP